MCIFSDLGVFSTFVQFLWFFLIVALRCLHPEVGKEGEAGEKLEISPSLGFLLASKSHADAAAGALLHV